MRRRALRYLSEAWAEQALAAVESDERVRRVLDGVKLSVLTIIQDGPEEAYGFMYVAFDGTGLSEYRVGHEYDAVADGIPRPTFAVAGKYSVFAQIMRGELTERRALLTGRLHLTGSLLKALRYMHAMETVTKVLQEIDCTT